MGNDGKALGDPRGYWMPPRFDEVRGMGECEAQARFYALGWGNVVAHPVTALRLAWTKFGTAMAARRPMIATTIMISTRVKPAVFFLMIIVDSLI